MINFFKNHKYILVLILIQSIVFYRWIFYNNIFTFGDIGIYPKIVQKELFLNSLFIYTSNFGLGSVNVTASSNPFLFLYGLLGYIGIDPVWSQKIMLFYPIIFGVIFSSYFFVYFLTKSKLASFVSSLFYSFNIYFLITLTGALYLSLGYAFAPLVLLFFLKIIESPRKSNKFLFTIFSVLLGFLEFRIFFIVAFIMFVYLLLYVYIEKITFRKTLDLLTHFIYPAIFFVLANIFWTLPLIKINLIASNELFDRPLFGESFFNIINSLVVFHPWWTWDIPTIFQLQIASPYLFGVLIFSAFVLFFIKSKRNLAEKQRDLFIFFIIFLIGVFLTKQSAIPIEGLYHWLYKNVPGFNAFREPSKFFLISSVGMSVILSFVVTRLRNKKKILVLFLMSLFLIIFANAYTMFSGKIETMFIPRNIPDEYNELNSFILSNTDYSRILWFPHINRFGINTNNHPAISMLLNIDTVYEEFSKDSGKKFEDHLFKPFDDEVFEDLISRQSIQYVIIPSNLVWDEVDSPWKNPENYIDKFNSSKYLKKIDMPFLEEKNIFIYENENFRPHIYKTKEKETIDRDIFYKNIEHISKNPTEYEIVLKNISDPLWINFSESYHPDWKLRIGDFHWWKVFWEGDEYFLSDEFHEENNAKLNSFYLNPKVICKEYKCLKNEDGSVNINMTLYFKLQSYFYLGLIVSITTLIGCVGYLMSHGIKRWVFHRSNNKDSFENDVL